MLLEKKAKVFKYNFFLQQIKKSSLIFLRVLEKANREREGGGEGQQNPWQQMKEQNPRTSGRHRHGDGEGDEYHQHATDVGRGTAMLTASVRGSQVRMFLEPKQQRSFLIQRMSPGDVPGTRIQYWGLWVSEPRGF